jgi:transposase
MPTHGGKYMKRMRRSFDREFKISVIAELEAGKPLAQVAREHGIHPSLPCRWKEELAENPEKAFSGNGNMYKDQAKIAELERLLGQAHAENELLKKAFAMTQRKIREERLKPTLRDGI